MSAMFILNLLVGYIYIYIYIYMDCMRCWIMMIDIKSELWDLVMMGWLSKLIVVDNLGCSKYKWNSTELKKIPSN